MISNLTIKIKGLSILLLVLFSFSNISATEKAILKTDITYVKIVVDGMACPFCAYGLEKSIKKLEGVKNLYIDINEAFITFAVLTSKKPSEEKLNKLVIEAGFKIRKIEYSSTPFEIEKSKK
jgi:copper chaperone CopZ